MATALVADIRRLTLHDGPGIRDTVFLKGCPLHCVWCHNPETQRAEQQLIFHEALCKQCGDCVDACPQGVHRLENGVHTVSRSQCHACGLCVHACLADAIRISGTVMTASQVFEWVMRDSSFYEDGQGGVTLSGGEPLLWADFAVELLEMLKERQIHTAVDTCGEVPFEALERVLPLTDLFLFDLKGMDDRCHRLFTGASNQQIHRNLEKLVARRAPLEIRMPMVPGLNDSAEELRACGNWLASIGCQAPVRLLAYHSMAHGKYRAAGMKDTLPDVCEPTSEMMAAYRQILQKQLPESTIYIPEER